MIYSKNKTISAIKSRYSLASTIIAVFCCMAFMSAPATASASTEHADYLTNNTFLSAEKEAPMPFSGLAVKWQEETPDGTNAELEVRFYDEDGWGKWSEIHGDNDSHHIKESNDSRNTAFISTDISTAFQYRVTLESQDPKVTPVIKDFEFTYIHARGNDTNNETLSASIPLNNDKFLGVTTDKTSLSVISRKQWGANEDLRVYKDDNPEETHVVKHEADYYTKFASELKLRKKVTVNSKGEELTWPIEYPEKVSKIIIHHTASSKNLNDPKQAIKDIYYFHTFSRGWGDIGYNYIIDQKGNIYEGRYGGDSVVGAHAGRANVGSIGIAVLGNYEEEEVPAAVTSSLAALIKSKAGKYKIDTMGSSKFRGEVSPNVMGHKDVMSTACPGKNLYALIPTVKAMAKNKFIATTIDKRRESQKSQYNYEISKNLDLFQIDGGGQKSLLVSIKNTGKESWGPNTYMVVNKTVSSIKYLAHDKLIRSAKSGKTIKPGSSVTFSIPIEAAHNGGFASIEVFPMINGKTKVEKYISIPIEVAGSDYDYELVSIDMNRKHLSPGQTVEAMVTIKNTGKTSWKGSGKNQIMLGTENPRDHVSRILLAPGSRLASMSEESVKPGENGHFKVKLKIPMRDGYYRLYFAPVIEGVTWLPDKGDYIDFYSSSSTYRAKYVGTNHDEFYLPGEKKTIWLDFENTGRYTWEKDGSNKFKLVIAKNSLLKVTDVVLDKDTILPGETGRVQLTVEAPEKEGINRLVISPKIGNNNLTLRSVSLYVRVSKINNSRIRETRKISSIQRNESDSNIRIGLSFRGKPIISANGEFTLLDGRRVLTTFSKNEKVSVNYSQGKYQVRGDNDAYAISNPPLFKPVGGSILRIDNYENHPSWKPELNDNMYRGTLEVHQYENELHVVNELPLENYLKGLAEIDASQHFEKIKSIIVLARSYAKYYITIGEKFPGAPFDLTDDPARSQFYLGYGFEVRNPTGVRAVNATSNEVVVYNGNVIKTPYFSASDGRTRSAQEVWGWTNTPYLISVDDPGCDGEEMRGHGVGLSGCGSLYMANQGKKYEEIIKYYFQGVEIKEVK